MDFKEIVEEKLNKMGKDRKYLADILNVNYQTLSSKFNRNSFDDSDIFRIANKLNIDLNAIRDEIYFASGVLGIWEEENNNNCKALSIDGNYCRSHNIDLSDEDKSLECAIECATKEILQYWGISYQLDAVTVKKIKNRHILFTSISINNKKYCIAFSEYSPYVSNKIVFSNECIINI